VAEFFNSLGEREMLLSLATFLGLSAILTLLIIGLIRLAVNRLKRFAALTATKLDDILLLFLENTLTLVIIVSAFFFVAGLVRPHQLITRYLELSFGLLIIVQIAYWANILINFFTDTYSAAKRAENIGAITTISALGFIAKLLLFFALLFVALDNFGVKVTTLIAGLGVGGIAIALAVQNILGDMFASLSIILDKPFVVGDFIVVDTYLGTVEHVGLKTTRIRSLSGEQLVFSNNDLLNSRIRNFKKMEERRVVFPLQVSYDTSEKLLLEIPVFVRQAIEEEPGARFDRAHFQAFTPGGLAFEVVYWVESPDYNTFIDIQQRINLKVLREFRRQQIEFSFPTQSIRLEQEADSPPRNFYRGGSA
jgi:small-conductance mechanosensitive channel